MLIGWFAMSYEEAGRVTLAQFQVYSKANLIKNQQQESMVARQAWMNQSVQATKGKGKNTKSAYSKYSDFYDDIESFENIFKQKPKEETKPLTLADRNRLANQRRKEEENG